jgi:phosphatidate cytidylyltransferase
MPKRILSTILLWTLVLGCIRLLGAAGGVWLVTVVSVLTQHEFYQMLRRMGLAPFSRTGLTLGALVAFAPALPLYFPHANPHLFISASPQNLLALAVVVFSLRVLAERDARNRVETLAWTLFGLIYVPFMLQFLVRIILIDTPKERTGLVLAIWLIAVSKGCDVGALLAGRTFGRHQMAPNISPKKTWEGAAGGVVFSALLGAAIAHGLPGNTYVHNLPTAFTPAMAALIALPVAALTMVSDLVESVIKRRADTKDSGATIPGIGGVFDLSDSLILTAPAGFLLFSLIS